MNTITADMATFSSAYIDDIVIYSDTFEEHIDHLEQIFTPLKNIGLRLKSSKCKIAEKHCHYLRHRVGNGEVLPLHAKIERLADLPVSPPPPPPLTPQKKIHGPQFSNLVTFSKVPLDSTGIWLQCLRNVGVIGRQTSSIKCTTIMITII